MTRCSSPEGLLRLPVTAAAVALACLHHGAAFAQTEASVPVRGTGIVPTLVVSETYLRGNGVIGVVEGGEFATRVSPGFTWSSSGGRLRGSVSYALDATQYSKRYDTSLIDNRLNANLKAEAVDGFAFVDVQANVGQQAISASGQQFAFDTFSGIENRTQVTNLLVSPYIAGRAGELFDYQLRLSAGLTDAEDFNQADSNTRSVLLSLASPGGTGPLGWALTAQRQDLSFRDGRDTENTRINGRLIWQPDTDLQFFASAGQESTNVGSIIRRTYDNYGGGGIWTPSSRTRVAIEAERRYFGNSWGASFQYRTPRTIWRYSDSRGSTDGGDPSGFDRPITLFELFFQQFASSTPDPVQREIAVRDFLRVLGRDPNELLDIGALTNVVSLQRRQELSAAWSGQRTTITLQFSSIQLSALDNAGNPADAPGASDSGARQRAVSASVSYRLTPLTSVTASATYQTSPPTDRQRTDNRLEGVSFGLSSRINRTMDLDLSARHSDFSSDTSPYRETAVSASLNFRF